MKQQYGELDPLGLKLFRLQHFSQDREYNIKMKEATKQFIHGYLSGYTTAHDPNYNPDDEIPKNFQTSIPTAAGYVSGAQDGSYSFMDEQERQKHTAFRIVVKEEQNE